MGETVDRFQKQRRASSWRRIALGTWRSPDDPTVYGLLDVDVTDALAFIQEERERTGVHITLTHLVGKAVATALRERPDANAIVRAGQRVYLRETVDIFFQVALDSGENLSGAKLRHVDSKDLADIAREMGDRVGRIRTHRDPELERTHRILRDLPAPMRRPLMRAMAFLTYDLGVNLERFGIPFDGFGSAMVTNVGMFDLPVGLAPIVPFSHCPIVLTIGSVQDRPMAVEGRVEIRSAVTIGATFDHRLIDGYQAGQLARRFRDVLTDPRSLGAR